MAFVVIFLTLLLSRFQKLESKGEKSMFTKFFITRSYAGFILRRKLGKGNMSSSMQINGYVNCFAPTTPSSLRAFRLLAEIKS